MRCPNCNSEDIQFISDVKTKNMSFLWILFCILTVGIGLIFWLIYIASKNTKTDTKAICKNCGEQWHVSKPKKKASIGGILLLIIIVSGAMGAYYYFGGNSGNSETVYNNYCQVLVDNGYRETNTDYIDKTVVMLYGKNVSCETNRQFITGSGTIIRIILFDSKDTARSIAGGLPNTYVGTTVYYIQDGSVLVVTASYEAYNLLR